jgi:two-component system sensor histidine kinase AlgZ
MTQQAAETTPPALTPKRSWFGKRATFSTEASAKLLPDLCSARSLLWIAAAMETVAILFTLVSAHYGPDVVLRFFALSLYLQWIGLCSAAVLCQARRRLGFADVDVVSLVCWLLLLAVTAVIALMAWEVEARFHFGLPIGESRGGFLIRNLGICAILSQVVLRYLRQRHEWEEYARTESDTRYLALQARIRPHFLFNSLNSIASLIRSQPDKAEDLVADLADLFRASLDERSRLAPMSDEIEIVKGYLRIEEARLDNKLLVNWDIPDDLMDVPVPRLIIQPLVENAVYHGIARLRARGLLHVGARREGEFLVITVDNPLPPDDAPKKQGTGVAIKNIAQRIKLIYGDRARLQLGPEHSDLGELFRATLRLPDVPKGQTENADEGSHR